MGISRISVRGAPVITSTSLVVPFYKSNGSADTISLFTANTSPGINYLPFYNSANSQVNIALSSS